MSGWITVLVGLLAISLLLEPGELVFASPARAPDSSNPHWQKNGCLSCHKGKPSKKSHRLKTKNINTLCNSCHEAISAHSYIHPVGVTPDKSMYRRMSPQVRKSVDQAGGKLSCASCHDMKLACTGPVQKNHDLNPLFLRDGAIRSKRDDRCFGCHDSSDYRSRNPHDQIDAKGKINQTSCLVCHDKVPEASSSSGGQVPGFILKSNLANMCTGCHKRKNHPGRQFTQFSGRNKEGPNHLVKMPEAMAKRFRKKTQELAIRMPLEPETGNVYCGTCHNAHERGVINNLPGVTGADSEHRLRHPAMCPVCHEK
ncbi:MAG: hypothetical protein OEZ10_01450 [Gammaproteobacteria bacterium]|nr:hypothetical protein [Gammaproteobacteria bacterium]